MFEQVTKIKLFWGGSGPPASSSLHLDYALTKCSFSNTLLGQFYPNSNIRLPHHLSSPGVMSDALACLQQKS